MDKVMNLAGAPRIYRDSVSLRINNPLNLAVYAMEDIIRSVARPMERMFRQEYANEEMRERLGP